MQNKFTQKAQSTLTRAAEEASALGHVYIGSEHLLLGLALEKDSIAARVLFARGLSPTLIKGSIIELCGEGERYAVSSKDLTPRAKKIIEDAGGIAKTKGCTYIGTEHLLGALLCEESCMAVKLIEASGVPCALLRGDLSAHQSSLASPKKEQKQKEESEPQRSRSKRSLSLYAKDLCALAAESKTDPTVGREQETARLVRILCRRSKNNPCLVGEPGVGKTAVVEGLAKLISDGRVPAPLSGKRILSLDIPSMIAGAKYRGEFEERMKAVMSEAVASEDIILFVDEMHVIVGAGAAEGAIDAANILKPALARGDIRMIGATTLSEYKRHIERDAALERRFQTVLIREPTVEETVEILKGLRPRLEEHHSVKISDGAILSAAKLSKRFIADRYLPDKAIDIIDEAAAKLAIETSDTVKDTSEKKGRKSNKRAALEQKHVEEAITELTGIPAERIRAGEEGVLSELESRLSSKVVGQQKAITAVSSAISRSRVGLRDPARPTGSFIFMGSTGVGKTELAAALAEELMGSREALIRFDMSEYMEKHSVSKLIGSPPGYVGYGDGGQLTEKIRRRPYSVVLFDEIEKAHPDIFSLLLQILDDGRLTDSEGRTVSFRDTVIIMTSNVGATDAIKRSTGFGDTRDQAKERERRMSDALRNTFSPEFLGRVDETVIFEELSEDALELIASKQLEALQERADEIGYPVKFDPELAELIARQAIGKRSGARDLRRIISENIEEYLASEILCGRLEKGCCVSVGKEAFNTAKA